MRATTASLVIAAGVALWLPSLGNAAAGSSQCNLGNKLFSVESGNSICAPLANFQCIQGCQWNTSCANTAHSIAFQGRRTFVAGMILTEDNFLLLCCASFANVVQQNQRLENRCVWTPPTLTIETRASVRFDPPLNTNEYVRDMSVTRLERGKVEIRSQICKFITQRTNCDESTMPDDDKQLYSVLQLRLQRTESFLKEHKNGTTGLFDLPEVSAQDQFRDEVAAFAPSAPITPAAVQRRIPPQRQTPRQTLSDAGGHRLDAALPREVGGELGARVSTRRGNPFGESGGGLSRNRPFSAVSADSAAFGREQFGREPPHFTHLGTGNSPTPTIRTPALLHEGQHSQFRVRPAAPLIFRHSNSQQPPFGGVPTALRASPGRLNGVPSLRVAQDGASDSQIGQAARQFDGQFEERNGAAFGDGSGFREVPTSSPGFQNPNGGFNEQSTVNSGFRSGAMLNTAFHSSSPGFRDHPSPSGGFRDHSPGFPEQSPATNGFHDSQTANNGFREAGNGFHSQTSPFHEAVFDPRPHHESTPDVHSSPPTLSPIVPSNSPFPDSPSPFTTMSSPFAPIRPTGPSRTHSHLSMVPTQRFPPTPFFSTNQTTEIAHKFRRASAKSRTWGRGAAFGQFDTQQIEERPVKSALAIRKLHLGTIHGDEAEEGVHAFVQANEFPTSNGFQSNGFQPNGGNGFQSNDRNGFQSNGQNGFQSNDRNSFPQNVGNEFQSNRNGFQPNAFIQTEPSRGAENRPENLHSGFIQQSDDSNGFPPAFSPSDVRQNSRPLIPITPQATSYGGSFASATEQLANSPQPQPPVPRNLRMFGALRPPSGNAIDAETDLAEHDHSAAAPPHSFARPVAPRPASPLFGRGSDRLRPTTISAAAAPPTISPLSAPPTLQAAMSGLMDCCQQQAPGCRHLCTPDVSKEEIKRAIQTHQCPPLSMTSVLQCFPRFLNITSVGQCCSRAQHGVPPHSADSPSVTAFVTAPPPTAPRLPNQCQSLCEPNFKLSFSHFACVDHISTIVDCYRALLVEGR